MNNAQKLAALSDRLDLLLLPIPKEADDVWPLGVFYPAEAVYKRCMQNGWIPPWVTYQAFLDCVEEYQKWDLGYMLKEMGGVLRVGKVPKNYRKRQPQWRPEI